MIDTGGGSTATAPQPLRAGEYQLVGRIGSGGMGEVYLGVSPTADRVAVKLIKPSLVGDDVRRRFAAEVEHLKTVFGARVARFEGADLEAEPAWLATAYVPGLTLKDYVDRHQPLPAQLAAMVGAMLAEGLLKVHEAGLLHRDLKPHNVILGPDGPVLIDFGVSVLRVRDSGLTEPGQLVGTPAFMAPEQARGDDRLTEQIDVYGLGATLVYAVTGHTLYPGVTGWALVMRITDPGRAPELSGVPSELAALLSAMVSTDPADRPDLRTAGRDLLRIAAGGLTEPARQRRRLMDLRAQIVSSTFDASAEFAVDSDLTDPVRDPEGRPEPPTTGTEQATGGPRSQPPGSGASARPRPDVTWLVERLRQQYARRPDL